MTTVEDFVSALSQTLPPELFTEFVSSVGDVVANSCGVEDWLSEVSTEFCTQFQLPYIVPDQNVLEGLMSFLQEHGIRLNLLDLTNKLVLFTLASFLQ
jgi:hypothetical protein